MSTLRTDFSGAFDAGLFAKTETTGTVAQSGGEMTFVYSAGYPGTVYVEDQTAVDVTDNDFVVKLSTWGTDPCRFYFAVLDASGRGWGFKIVGGSGASTFGVFTATAGIGTESYFASYGDYNNAVHIYLRCRHSSSGGSKIYWDYSTDGSSWTSRTNTTTPTMTLTAVKARFGQFSSDGTGTYGVTDYWAPTIAGGGTNIGLTRRTGRYPLGGFLNNGFIR